MQISKSTQEFLSIFVGTVCTVAAIAAFCLIAFACQSRPVAPQGPDGTSVASAAPVEAIKTVQTEAKATGVELKAAAASPTLPAAIPHIQAAEKHNAAVVAALPPVIGAVKAEAVCQKENAALKDAPAAAARQAQAQGLSAGIKFSVVLGGLAVLAGIASFLPWTAPFVPFVVAEVLGAASVLLFIAVSTLAAHLQTATRITFYVACAVAVYYACRFLIRHHIGHYLDAAKSHLVASIGGAWMAIKGWAAGIWTVCLTWIKTAWPIVKKDAAAAKNWSVAELQKAGDKAVELKGKAAILESKVADAVKKL